MNIRMMTISSVFAAAWAILVAATAADERDAPTNPLRNPDRTADVDDVLRSFPPQPPSATGETPRSPQGFWRNPGWLRSSAASTAPGDDLMPDATAPSAATPGDAAGEPPVAPPRTLIQRIRERRLAQLEKQAARLRQLSAGENRQGPDGRGSADPNGPENPDLQIDLGVPVDAPGQPTASLLPPHPPAMSPAPSAEWPPGPPAPATAAPPTELNPPADPPIEINIDLPSDIEPPQPKPALQSRVRNWWSAPR